MSGAKLQRSVSRALVARRRRRSGLTVADMAVTVVAGGAVLLVGYFVIATALGAIFFIAKLLLAGILGVAALVGVSRWRRSRSRRHRSW
ncbi:MAG: hypothetical protein ACYDH5_07780 [Acidimicrobiales bacterium]